MISIKTKVSYQPWNTAREAVAKRSTAELNYIISIRLSPVNTIWLSRRVLGDLGETV